MQEKVKVLTLHDQETGVEDRYALSTSPVGEGKYAKVYKATNVNDPSKVFAVKVIKIDNQEVKKEYLKELKIIKNLPNCPNLVKTHKEHLESKNNLYIFQEFCDAGTLMSYKTDKFGVPLTEEEIYDLFFQVTNGMITLLEAGIVHEDIKPVNILRKGRVFKLCDFGVSQFSSQCKETTTRRGTISYMPPQKLKSRRFLPNQKSDMYSLGICVYQTIFGFHPYLKKKTTNYKEYLQGLQEAGLTPIPILMKKVKSSSLRLENFLQFLHRMIDLNQKTRASLSQLKEFVRTTQPFKFMAPHQESTEYVHAQNYPIKNNYDNLFESVIDYRRENKDQLNLTTPLEKIKLVQAEPQPEPEPEEISKPPEVNHQQIMKQTIIAQFQQENPYIVDVIGYMIRGIQSIRRSNFCELNLTPIGKNITNADIPDCKVSRYLKYLIYEFANIVRKRQLQRYQDYISEEMLQGLQKDASHLNNQFNKFLIESTFVNKDKFGEELEHVDKLELWREISSVLQENLKNVSIIKQNRKEELLSILYCCYMPKLFALLANVRSIFSSSSLKQQLTESYLGETSIENGKNLLLHIFELQGQKMIKIREGVEKQLEKRQIQVFFEIEQSSGQIQIIQENDLE